MVFLTTLVKKGGCNMYTNEVFPSCIECHQDTVFNSLNLFITGTSYCLIVTWLLSNIYTCMSRNQEEYVNKLKRVATTKEKQHVIIQVLCICIMQIATLTSTV